MAHVAHWEIGAKDGKKVRDFYSNLFDWEIDTNNSMNYGMVASAGEGGINGGIAQRDDSHITFYVDVDDLQAYLDKAESLLGGKTIMPPTTIPDVFSFAIFSDPEGNFIGLVKGGE